MRVRTFRAVTGELVRIEARRELQFARAALSTRYEHPDEYIHNLEALATRSENPPQPMSWNEFLAAAKAAVGAPPTKE